MYPFEFLGRMGVGVERAGPMRPTDKGIFCTVIPLVPTHKRSFRNVIPTTDIGNVPGIPIGFDGMIAGNGFMW